MFSRLAKNLIRKEFSVNIRRVLKRNIVISQHSSQQIAPKVKEDIIVSSPLPSAFYPNWTIDQYVWNDINQWSSKTAVVDGITDRSVTYGELRDRCRALAIRLQSVFRLNFGDTIAMCLPNSIEFPTICLAANEAGVIVTTVNPIYTPDEIARQLIDSNAKVFFGLTSMSKVLQEAVALTKRDIRIVYAKSVESELLPAGGIDLNELTNTQGIDFSSLDVCGNPENIALLPYSSGTTGKCKGVQITHKNIVSNGIQGNCENGNYVTAPAYGSHQDIVPCVLPFFHIYGLVCTMYAKLAHGSQLITLPSFTPDSFLNVLEKHEASVLYLVPPIIIFLSNYNKAEPKHMRSVKYVMSGAAPLGQSDAERFNLKAPKARFYQGYGLTESSPIILATTMDSTNYASVGVPVTDTEIKIVRVDDPEMRGVGPNISGELWARGPQVMKGYHNNEKATRETITPDGWLRTGDIGHYDENHEFYITDRLKELIKVKGFQVPPAELEEILRDHPDIADAAVIGVRDDRSGEVPRAYVVIKNPNITENDVKDYVAEQVAKYKRLEGGVEFIKAIPKNATGKILRRELKKLFESS